MDDLVKVFANPGSQYRGKPFWAWNGKLEAGELRRQIRVMHRMGLGGFFMHSRVGLDTAYLSDEWFEMVGACIDEAKKLGMEAWLYDEDRWPSGAAGGLVTCDPRWRHKNLIMVVCDSADELGDNEPIALFRAVVDGVNATDVHRLEAAEPAGDGAKLLAFLVLPDEPNTWFNNYTYLDTMNPEAVARFIEVTHQAYKDRCGEFLGNVVPGIFTDEPHHGTVLGTFRLDGREHPCVPWTGELPRRFEERYGYDILDYLPHLFLNVDGEEVSQPRYHYHDCKTFLFVDAFARQIGEWCERNDMLSTGHVLSERTLISQSRVGGAAMRFYEFMQAPGVDQLTEHLDEYTTAKQCSSVLHQTGRRWMLSELYGCTGWDWPFEGHKAVGDWQAVLGVNLRCQHLSWYTMSGQAKRDYPASISFQSPWWRRYARVEDYYARVNAAMSRGKAVQKLLVVHPVESAWARANVDWHDDPQLGRMEEEFEELVRILLGAHVDFDYGDEEMMARLAAVEGGDAPALTLGEAAYRVALVPAAETIRSTTLELLGEFSRAGGAVVFCQPVPRYVDALRSDAAAELAASCPCVPFERDAIVSAVEAARVVSITDETGAEKRSVFYLLRRDGEDLRLFVINTDRQEGTGPLTVSVQGEGSVQLWDAESGRRHALASEQADGAVRFDAEMPPCGSRLFVITPRSEELEPAQTLSETRAVEPPADAWSAELSEPNVLVLDTLEYRAGDGEWSGPTEVLRADRKIREAIGLPLRSGRMVQPWARERSEGPSAPLELRYRIEVDGLPSGPLMLAMENPERFTITLNGYAVLPDDDSGWWVDPCIRLLPVPAGALVRGENVLEMSADMDDGCQLEICYLLGALAVAVDGARARITGGVPEVGLGDWTGQGLPFYSGSVVYRTVVEPALQDGERAFVEVPQFGGVCVRVLVDGAEAGVIPWRPYEVEVTDLVAGRDRVELAVEVISHRRNAFGPLHTTVARPQFVGPSTFTTGGDEWQDEYSLVPAGCLAPPRLSVRTPSAG